MAADVVREWKKEWTTKDDSASSISLQKLMKETVKVGSRLFYSRRIQAAGMGLLQQDQPAVVILLCLIQLTLPMVLLLAAASNRCSYQVDWLKQP